MALVPVGSPVSAGANTKDVSLTLPSGIQVGDLLLAQWTTGAAVRTPPTGWQEELATGVSSLFTYWAFKVADAGDTATPTLTFGQGGNTPTSITVTVYRGDFDPADPLDIVGFISTGTSATISSPSRSMPVDGYVLNSAGVRGATSYTSTPPAGHTEMYDRVSGGATTPFKTHTAAYRGTGGSLDLITAGTSIGGLSFTAASSVAAGQQQAHNVVIRQLNAGPPEASGAGTFGWVGAQHRSGPLDPAVHDPGVVLYVAHRGGADIFPPETMYAYTSSVNNKHGLEGDVYMLSAADGNTEEERMALVHDSDLGVGGADLLQSDGVTPVSAGTSVTTVTPAQYDAMWVEDPLGVADAHPARWRNLLLFAKTDTGDGYWHEGRLVLLESKASGSLSPIINSVTNQGMIHQVLANSFDLGRCQSMAAAGLHVMWLTTSFASRSAAQVKADGIEWVGWQAGTSGFSTFLSDAHAAGLYVNVYGVTSASQRDTYTVQGVESISTDRPDLVFPDGPPEASGTGTFGWTGAGVGDRDSEASGTGSFAWAGAGTGDRDSEAAGTGTFQWSGIGAASRPSDAMGSGSFGWAGAGTGQRDSEATGTGTFTFTGAGTGDRDSEAAGSGSYAYSGTGTASRPSEATGSGTWTYAGAGTSERDSDATGSGTFTWSGAGVGHAPSIDGAEASGSGEFGWAGDGTASRPSQATGAGTFTYSGAGTSSRNADATGAGTYGWIGAGSAAGIVSATGSGVYGWHGVGIGARASRGTGAGVFTWVGAGVGVATEASTGTPSERIVAIPAHNGVAVIPAEDRTATVPAQSRAVEVPA